MLRKNKRDNHQGEMMKNDVENMIKRFDIESKEKWNEIQVDILLNGDY